MATAMHGAFVTRLHALLGYRFLEHAKIAFEEKNLKSNAKKLSDEALPHILEIRFSVASRFLWLCISQIAVAWVLVDTITQTYTLWIQAMAAMAGSYAVMTIKETYIDYTIVDDVCRSCDIDLKKVGCLDVFEKLVNDPTKDTTDG